MDTGKFLRKLRSDKGLSLDEVVERAKNQIDKTTLSRIERNERGVSLTAAFLLSKIYDEDFEAFSRKILQLKGVSLPRK